MEKHQTVLMFAIPGAFFVLCAIAVVTMVLATG
jgi:peroxiredoxin